MESNCSKGVHVSSFPLGNCDHNLLCVAIIRLVPWKDTLTTKARDEDQGPKREAKYLVLCTTYFISKVCLSHFPNMGILFYFLVKDALKNLQ
jgi:hypothetical protein